MMVSVRLQLIVGDRHPAAKPGLLAAPAKRMGQVAEPLGAA